MQQASNWRRPGKGRPRKDDEVFILQYFARAIRQGRRITDICRSGISLLMWAEGPNGGSELMVGRTLNGETLASRYRTLRGRLTVLPGAGGASRAEPMKAASYYYRASSPLLSELLPADPPKAGRPKKN